MKRTTSSVKVELPQVSTARPLSETICTGREGRLRLISASSLPDTSALPSSSVVTATVACADTS